MPIVQNEPNLTWHLGAAESKCAKQSQFRRESQVSSLKFQAGETCRKPSASSDFKLRTADAAAAGPLVQTKPIPSEGRKSQVLAGKRVMVDWTGTALRRNKANSRRRQPGRSVAGRAGGGPPPGTIVRKKPNLGGRAGHRRAKCAKRTQFFNCGSRIWDCGCREACGLPPGLAGPAAQTKPIGRSQSCETNPICPARPGMGARPRPGGPDGERKAQNEPNSREFSGRLTYFGGKQSYALSEPRQVA
jgi:hypothetical protein